jgi:DNA-binding MarR family transcriptional regulator
VRTQARGEPTPHSEGGKAVTDVVMTTFRLHGLLMDVAQRLAAEGGMTAAWWQVLGGVVDEPRTIPEIGRRMGLTRQGVQRVANLLVEQGLAEYRTNPNHQRAKLLACTHQGEAAIRRIALAQHPWANRIGDAVGATKLRQLRDVASRLIDVLESDDEMVGA